MAKVKTDTKKKAPKKMSRSGDPDVDLAKARSLDDDTANDDAELDVDEVEAQDSDEPSEPAKDAAAGHPDAESEDAARTQLASAEFSVSTQAYEASGELGASKRHFGCVRLKDGNGEEYEFSVNEIATARHIANQFSGLADELSRRRM